MIILFEENENLFQSIGLGILADAKSCIVKEGLNDNFELEMQYPITGANFSKITLNRIIYTKSNPYSDPQPFRIDSISKPINGIITVKAVHISYDMNGLPVKPISGSGPKDTLDKIQNGCLIAHNFKFYTDILESKTFKTYNYYNMRAILMGSDESFLEVYKGELLFDKFNVYILSRRGSNKGASVRYSKNMKDITHEVNYERLYNGVYPFYHKEEVEATTNTTSDGFKQVYIVGTKPFQDGWLSYTPDGEPYHPIDESPVQIASEGDYKDKVYTWNTTTQRYAERVYNEMVDLVSYVTDLISPSDKPSWIYIDASSLPSIVVKANTNGYFKLATDTDWSKKSKGEVIFQGSILNASDGLIMYFSEVIPSSETSTETETTNITHIELEDKIIWLKTDAASDMKYDRILTLDLTSEFDDVPDQDKLLSKANEYIDKNKIGQYKYDTKVSFVDLYSTTEGTVYDKIETIELGDTVRVIYEGLGIDVELRVISTTYNAITDKYEDIELGEKPEKISSSSVQTGDNVSSLTNDVGYADTTTVNKLIAKTITADLIQAKNAKLSKAQIEELQAARIKITGMLEATQFELDTLVAKMLTADNAVIKHTLEAGTVKVKGDISVTSGSIKIQNTESGTVFNVDRDGNVTANSVSITGGELNINDNFIVTPDGILTATGAQIKGRIEADSGLIARFNIESVDLLEGTSNRLYSGTPGADCSVLMSPGYNIRVSALDNNEQTRDSHNWVFLAGRYFGVDDTGKLYASEAIIQGSITATSGSIGGFTIASDKLYSTYVEISPTNIKYGQNNEFVLTNTGSLTIQNGSDPTAEGYQSIKLDSNGLTATAITVNNADINLGFIGGFTIGQEAIYKDISSFDSNGTSSGVYLGPDGLRIGKSLKLYPDGRIMSGSREYNEDNEYYYGDYCTHLNSLYKCISNYTTGEWDSTDWEEVAMTSFGVDDTGKLVASSAEIIGKITAESGYIGNPGEGFTITSKAIYNGFTNPDGSAMSTGIYIGTDGIRLGKNPTSIKTVIFGDLTNVNTTLTGTIEDSKTNYIGAEFELSYAAKTYDRYITIREKEDLSATDDDSKDYIHISNPKFIPIIAKTKDGITEFNLDNIDYIYLNCDDQSLWQYNESTEQYDFIGTTQSSLRLYFDRTISTISISVEVFSGEDDWLTGRNPRQRFSGNINIASNRISADFVLAATDSPWIRLKIQSGQSRLSNCRIMQDTPKVVLLPANSSRIKITPVKYNNFKIKYAYGELSSTPEVSNLILTSKIVPGFLVTPDGMMNAYNAKIWGHFEGDIKIYGGSISIIESGSNSALINKITLASSSIFPPMYYISVANMQNICAVLGITYSTYSQAKTDIVNVLPTTGWDPLTEEQLMQVYQYANVEYPVASFYVDNNGNLKANSATIKGRITADSGNISGFIIETDDIRKGIVGSTNSVLVSSSGYSATISNLDSQNAHDWTFTSGQNFGVDVNGYLYANNAKINGKITSSEGTIGGFTISSGSLLAPTSAQTTGFDNVGISSTTGEAWFTKLELWNGYIHTHKLFSSYSWTNGPVQIEGDIIRMSYWAGPESQEAKIGIPLIGLIAQACACAQCPIRVGFYNLTMSQNVEQKSFTIDSHNGPVICACASYQGIARNTSLGVSWSNRTITVDKDSTSTNVTVSVIYICYGVDPGSM